MKPIALRSEIVCLMSRQIEVKMLDQDIFAASEREARIRKSTLLRSEQGYQFGLEPEMKEPTKPPSLKQPVPRVDDRTLRGNGKTSQFKVWITEALHTEIKVFAAQRRMKLGELVEQAFAMPEIWKEPTKPPSPKQPVPGVDGRTLRRNGKTTQFKVSIPEELHIEIKGIAAQRRMKLGELVEQAFAILKQEQGKSAARLPKVALPIRDRFRSEKGS